MNAMSAALSALGNPTSATLMTSSDNSAGQQGQFATSLNTQQQLAQTRFAYSALGGGGGGPQSMSLMPPLFMPSLQSGGLSQGAPSAPPTAFYAMPSQAALLQHQRQQQQQQHQQHQHLMRQLNAGGVSPPTSSLMMMYQQHLALPPMYPQQMFATQAPSSAALGSSMALATSPYGVHSPPSWPPVLPMTTATSTSTTFPTTFVHSSTGTHVTYQPSIQQQLSLQIAAHQQYQQQKYTHHGGDFVKAQPLPLPNGVSGLYASRSLSPVKPNGLDLQQQQPFLSKSAFKPSLSPPAGGGGGGGGGGKKTPKTKTPKSKSRTPVAASTPSSSHGSGSEEHDDDAHSMNDGGGGEGEPRSPRSPTESEASEGRRVRSSTHHRTKKQQLSPGDDDDDGKPKSGSRVPVSCSVCGLTLTRRASLRGHMRIHTGERPYKCSEWGDTGCSKSFRQLSNLYRHRKSHCANCRRGKSTTRPPVNSRIRAARRGPGSGSSKAATAAVGVGADEVADLAPVDEEEDEEAGAVVGDAAPAAGSPSRAEAPLAASSPPAASSTSSSASVDMPTPSSSPAASTTTSASSSSSAVSEAVA